MAISREQAGTLNVLVIDDEAEACEHLIHMLQTIEDYKINVMATAQDTAQAELLIRKLHPDAVFIDIEMPEENAIQFLERISPFSFQVVFVTAYDDYAIRAFKMNALDYILKPISKAEVQEACKKIAIRLQQDKLLSEQGLYQSIAAQLQARNMPSRFRFRSGNTVDLVAPADIFYLEAQGPYSRIFFQVHNTPRTITMSQSLTDYEELLPADLFYRIHKSYFVNCRHIHHIITHPSPAVVLAGDISLPVSRRRYAGLLSFLSTYNFAVNPNPAR